MERLQEMIGNRQCRVYACQHPVALLIQPMGRQELPSIDHEAELITASDRPFVMAAFAIDDWDKELTPWPDPAISAVPEVGQHAGDTLYYIEHELLPWLHRRYGELPCVLGGYSLGGLFSLWAATQSTTFAAVVASSPSVWVRDWLTFAEGHPTHASCVFLSLGDREEHVMDKSIAQVGNNIRQYHQMLAAQLGDERTTLVWNRGNHFQHGAERTAAGFVWCLGNCPEK